LGRLTGTGANGVVYKRAQQDSSGNEWWRWRWRRKGRWKWRKMDAEVDVKVVREVYKTEIQ
jgi:hypothetical protein